MALIVLISLLFSKRIFAEFSEVCFFFLYFNDVALLSSSVHFYQQRDLCHFNLYPSVFKENFSLGVFKIFSFSLILRNSIMIYFGAVFVSYFLCWFILEISGFVDLHLSFNLDILGQLFLQIYLFLFLSSFLLFFRNLNYTYIRLLEVVLQITDVLFNFLGYFLCFILYNFYFYVFKLNNLLFCSV